MIWRAIGALGMIAVIARSRRATRPGGKLNQQSDMV